MPVKTVGNIFFILRRLAQRVTEQAGGGSEIGGSRVARNGIEGEHPGHTLVVERYYDVAFPNVFQQAAVGAYQYVASVVLNHRKHLYSGIVGSVRIGFQNASRRKVNPAEHLVVDVDPRTVFRIDKHERSLTAGKFHSSFRRAVAVAFHYGAPAAVYLEQPVPPCGHHYGVAADSHGQHVGTLRSVDYLEFVGLLVEYVQRIASNPEIALTVVANYPELVARLACTAGPEGPEAV